MSYEVEDRVVEMRFDNSDFERNVDTSIKSLSKLEKSLEFKEGNKGFDKVNEAIKKVDFAPVQVALETISNKFSVMQVAAITAISEITKKVINAASNMMRALTIDPIKSGWAEYGEQLSSIQVIMANTKAPMVEVEKQLDELNKYADLTSYSFNDMTTAISKFSAAGVGLDDSVKAIKGLSNAAALVGAQKSQLYSAYYNLAQSMQMGYMTLIDWKSIANSSIGNKEFRENLIKMAIEMGKFGENSAMAAEAYSDFNGSLNKRWLTKDVIARTLEMYSGDLEERIDATTGAIRYFDKAGKEVDEYWGKLGKSALNAATEIKNLSDLWGMLQESVQTGWADTWSKVIGDLDQSKTLFTAIGRKVTEILDGVAKARNEFMGEWVVSGGRSALVEGLLQSVDTIWSILKPIIQAVNDVFPFTGKMLANITKGFRDFVKSLELSEAAGQKLRKVLVAILTPVKYLLKAIQVIFYTVKFLVTVVMALAEVVIELFKNFSMLPMILANAIGFEKFSKILTVLSNVVAGLKLLFFGLVKAIVAMANAIWPVIQQLSEPLKELFVSLLYLGYSIITLLSKIDFTPILRILNVLITLAEYAIRALAFAISFVADLISSFTSKIKSKSSDVKATTTNLGVNVVEGFVNGIKNNTIIQSVVAAVSKVANLAITTIKSILGIHSPSKVFFVIGGFLIAGLVSGIAYHSKDILGVMQTVGSYIVNGITTAINYVVNSPAFKAFAAILKELGSIFMNFLRQLTPGQAILILFAVSIIVLANSIRHLAGAFSFLGDLAAGFVARMRAQAFDQVANGIMKIILALTVLMGVAMLDPDKFRHAAITLGVLSAALLTLYFVLNRLDSVLSTIGGSLKIAARTFISSSFFTAFAGSILMLTLALRMLTQMDESNIWNSVKVLISVMAAMAAMSIAMSAMAPRLSKGALFLLLYASATKQLAKALEQMKETFKGIENFKQYTYQLVATMAAVYIASRSLQTVINGVVTTISRTVINVFYSLAIAAIAAGVSIFLYGLAMKYLTLEIGDFNETARTTMIGFVSLIGILGAAMSVMAAFSLFDRENRIRNVLFAVAANIAIVTGGLVTLLGAIALLQLAARDIGALRFTLISVGVILSLIGGTMIAITALSRRANVASFTALTVLMTRFLAVIAVVMGSISVLAVEFAIINRLNGLTGIISSIGGVFLLLSLIFGAVIGLMAMSQKTNAAGIASLQGIMALIIGLFASIVGSVMVLAVMMIAFQGAVGKVWAAIGMVAILIGAMIGIIAMTSYITRRQNGNAALTSAAAFIITFGIAIAGVMAAVTAMTILLRDYDTKKIIAMFGSIVGMFTAAIAIIMLLTRAISGNQNSMLALYGVSGLILSAAASLVALFTAITWVYNQLSRFDINELWRLTGVIGALAGGFTLIVAVLAGLAAALGNAGIYAVVGAAIILALAAAVYALGYALSNIARNGGFEKLANDLTKFYDILAQYPGKMGMIVGALAALGAGLLILSPGFLLVSVGITLLSAAIVILTNGVEILTEAFEHFTAGLINVVAAFKLLLKVIEDISEEAESRMRSLVAGILRELAESLESISSSILKIASAFAIMAAAANLLMIPLLVIAISTNFLVPMILSLGLAFSLAALGIGVIVGGLYLLITHLNNVDEIGNRILKLVDYICQAIDKLAGKAEILAGFSAALSSLGAAMLAAGIGFALMGAGLIAGSAGLLLGIGVIYLALKLWKDQIEAIVNEITGFYAMMTGSEDESTQAMEIADRFATVFSNLGAALRSFGSGIAFVAFGIGFLSGSLVTIAIGLAAVAGALWLFNKLGITTSLGNTIEDVLMNVASGLAVMGLVLLIFLPVVPMLLVAAAGLLVLGKALQEFDDLSDSGSVAIGLVKIAGGLLVLLLAMLVGLAGTVGMVVTAGALATLVLALMLFDAEIVGRESAISKSLTTLGGGLLLFALEMLVAGFGSVGMILVALGLAVLSEALNSFYNTLKSSYIAIAQILNDLRKPILDFFTDLSGNVWSSVSVAAIAASLIMMAIALGMWNVYISTQAALSIGRGMAFLSGNIKAFATAMDGCPFIRMYPLSFGIMAMALALGVWQSIVTKYTVGLSNSFLVMSKTLPGFLELLSKNAMAGLSLIPIAIGLTAMAGALAVWVAISDGLSEIPDIMNAIAEAVIAIGKAAIYSPAIVILGLALVAFSVSVLIASVAMLAVSGILYLILNILVEAVPLIVELIDEFSTAIDGVRDSIAGMTSWIYDSAVNIGNIFSNGFSKGISDQDVANEVYTAAAALGQFAVDALAGPDGIDDPMEESAKAHEVGTYVDNGFKGGMVEDMDEVYNAGAKVGQAGIDGLNSVSGGSVEAGKKATKSFGETIGGWFSNTFSGSSVGKTFSGAWDKIKNGAVGLKDKVVGIFSGDKDGKSILGLDFDGITARIKAAFQEMKTSFGGGDDVFGGLGASAEKAKGTVKSLADTIKQQMNMFEKFDDSTDMSSEQLLKNMESQLNGITNWANGIEELGLRGMSAELIKYLGDMGPQGYKYVEAFLDMTESELAHANEMYTDSLSLPDRAANTVKRGYEAAGVEIVEAMAAGMGSASDSVVSATEDLGDKVEDQNEENIDKINVQTSDGTANTMITAIDRALETVTDPSQQQTLKNVRSALIHGWTPDPQELTQAWSLCYDQAENAFVNYLNTSGHETMGGVLGNFFSTESQQAIELAWLNAGPLVQSAIENGVNSYAGKTVTLDLTKFIISDDKRLNELANTSAKFVVAGIGQLTAREYVKLCREQGGMLAAEIIAGYDQVMKIQSPSKVMAEKAMYTVMGISAGLEESEHLATKSAEDVGTNVADSLTNSLASISDVFGTDFDNLNPTITPVLDLTNVESGANRLNQLLNNNTAVVSSMEIRNPGQMQVNSLNATLDKLRSINEQNNRELIDAILSSDKQVNVNVSLEGDAEGVFKLVEDQNLLATKARGVSPLMTMYNNGITAKRAYT